MLPYHYFPPVQIYLVNKIAMNSSKHNPTHSNGGYSQRGTNTQQNNRINNQHIRQGYETETITKFMKNSKVHEKSAESVQVSLKMQEALGNDIGFIRSEVFKEIEIQKPYSCIIENTLSKIKCEPLKQLLRDLLSLIEKEEERIKSNTKMSKLKINKRRQQIYASERKQNTSKSGLLSPHQFHKETFNPNYQSEFKDRVDDEEIPFKQQAKGSHNNPEQLKVQSKKKVQKQLKIECEDIVSQKRFKQLQKFISEAEKKRDQLAVELTNLLKHNAVQKSIFLKSKQENQKQKHNYASRISESHERNKLQEEQKERFLQNLQLAEVQYNNRIKEISQISLAIQQLHLEQEMMKQRKAKLSEQIQELNNIIDRLDRRIDSMNRQLSKLHAQYGRQSAHRIVKQKIQNTVNESQQALKPQFFRLKSTQSKNE